MKPLAEMGKFKTVVVDPPWDIQMPQFTDHEFAPRLVYETMDIDAIGDMPMNAVLDDDAVVFVWTVNRFLNDTFDIMRSWSAEPWFTMAWLKGGGPQFPGGVCFNTEFIVVGRKGSPQWLSTKSFRTGNAWPRRGHSEKPEEFYDLLRRVTPAPRLDVFGRRPIAGFQSWGNEAPEGPAPEGHYQDVMGFD